MKSPYGTRKPLSSPLSLISDRTHRLVGRTLHFPQTKKRRRPSSIVPRPLCVSSYTGDDYPPERVVPSMPRLFGSPWRSRPWDGFAHADESACQAFVSIRVQAK